MTSALEKIPLDVLQFIAALAASSSTLDPPVEILNLMRTRSSLYEALNIRAAPHVYASIFSSKFDINAPFRRYRTSITDSAMAAELVNRCRLLQRSKRADISSANLLQDLSTALWMYLESDGLNEHQLRNVGFPNFILLAARTYLKGTTSSSMGIQRAGGQAPTLIRNIIIWLLCLGLPRRSLIVDMAAKDRKELYSWVFPFIHTAIPQLQPCLNCQKYPLDCVCIQSGVTEPNSGGSRPAQQSLDGSSLQESTYRRRKTTTVPDPSIAAINLASVIFDSLPLKIPPHLQENGAIAANVGQMAGPTAGDFKAFASYKTPLFADSTTDDLTDINVIPAENRSALLELEFRRLLNQTKLEVSYPKITYIVGSMTAVWEGVFRTIEAPANYSADGLIALSYFVKPIQCALKEYTNEDLTSPEQQEHLDNLIPSDLFLCPDDELYVRGYKYSKYDASVNAVEEDESKALVQDVILYGETLENHDQAWGGYTFWGMVSEDGSVNLKRSAKFNEHNTEGLWEFEGRLRFGTVLVGRWRMTGASDNIYHGIFTMTRL